MSIKDLPVEILEQIAREIESLSDLCSFGVSRKLHSIVVPNHTQLRIIRCPLLSSVWEKLSVHRSLAANVRVLEIQSAGINRHSNSADPPVIPAIFDEPSKPLDRAEDDEESKNLARLEKNTFDLQAERILVSALRNMTGLVSFRWSRTPPLIDPDLEDDVWTTLIKYCPNLREVNVLDHGESGPYQIDEDVYHRPTSNPAFFSFNDLTSFSLSLDAYNVALIVMPGIKPLAEMLVERNPDLQVLRIELLKADDVVIPVYALLSHSHWQSLRELRLSPASAPSVIVSAFLSSHPTIEHLSLWGVHGYRRASICSSDRLVLPSNALPHLRILNASRDDILSILNSTAPDATPKPLQRISGIPIDAEFLECLKKSGSAPTLKRLDATSYADADLIVNLASIVPGLEWLDAGNIHVWNVHASHYQHYRSPDEQRWRHGVTHFRSLVTLDGVGLLFSNRPSKENSRIICTLVCACPRLRRMAWCTPTGSDFYVVVIERTQGWVKWEVRLRVGDKEGDAVNRWGEDGKGSFEI